MCKCATFSSNLYCVCCAFKNRVRNMVQTQQSITNNVLLLKNTLPLQNCLWRAPKFRFDTTPSCEVLFVVEAVSTRLKGGEMGKCQDYCSILGNGHKQSSSCKTWSSKRTDSIATICRHKKTRPFLGSICKIPLFKESMTPPCFCHSP
jgi:hypothetical protein